MGIFSRAKQKDKIIEEMKVLLDRFEFTDFEKLCTDVIGKKPLWRDDNERPERIHYLEFIWQQYRNGALNYQQVKDFALNQGIVPQDFFD